MMSLNIPCKWHIFNTVRVFSGLKNYLCRIILFGNIQNLETLRFRAVDRFDNCRTSSQDINKANPTAWDITTELNNNCYFRKYNPGKILCR